MCLLLAVRQRHKADVQPLLRPVLDLMLQCCVKNPKPSSSSSSPSAPSACAAGISRGTNTVGRTADLQASVPPSQSSPLIASVSGLGSGFKDGCLNQHFDPPTQPSFVSEQGQLDSVSRSALLLLSYREGALAHAAREFGRTKKLKQLLLWLDEAAGGAKVRADEGAGEATDGKQEEGATGVISAREREGRGEKEGAQEVSRDIFRLVTRQQAALRMCLASVPAGGVSRMMPPLLPPAAAWLMGDEEGEREDPLRELALPLLKGGSPILRGGAPSNSSSSSVVALLKRAAVVVSAHTLGMSSVGTGTAAASPLSPAVSVASHLLPAICHLLPLTADLVTCSSRLPGIFLHRLGRAEGTEGEGGGGESEEEGEDGGEEGREVRGAAGMALRLLEQLLIHHCR